MTTAKRKPNTDHVVLGNNSFRCLHCGEEYGFNMPSIDMLSAMSKAYAREHRSCKPDPAARERRYGFKTPEEWIRSWDTGISSRAIWVVMTGRPDPSPSFFPRSPPCDPSDFGRCYRLLKAFPAWRARLPEVAQRWPEWTAVVGAWDELTSLFEEETSAGGKTAPKLYARMQALRAVRP